MISENLLKEILEDDLGIELDGIESDTLLFSSGIVDSFALVTLMMRIEQETGLKINPSDVTLENFDSMQRMVSFVERAKSE